MRRIQTILTTIWQSFVTFWERLKDICFPLIEEEDVSSVITCEHRARLRLIPLTQCEFNTSREPPENAYCTCEEEDILANHPDLRAILQQETPCYDAFKRNFHLFDTAELQAITAKPESPQTTVRIRKVCIHERGDATVIHRWLHGEDGGQNVHLRRLPETL